MLKRLKVVSSFLLECFMFGVAGLLGVLFIPFVIGAAWIELFKEMKNAIKELGRPLPHAEGTEELDGEEVEPAE